MANPAERPLTRQITLVCELLSEPAAGGEIVGRVQVVSTGEVVPITCVAELIALVHRLAHGA